MTKVTPNLVLHTAQIKNGLMVFNDFFALIFQGIYFQSSKWTETLFGQVYAIIIL